MPEAPDDRVQQMTRPRIWTPWLTQGVAVNVGRFVLRRQRFGHVEAGRQDHRRSVGRGGVTVRVDHCNSCQSRYEKQDPRNPDNLPRAAAPASISVRTPSRQPGHHVIAYIGDGPTSIGILRAPSGVRLRSVR